VTAILGAFTGPPLTATEIMPAGATGETFSRRLATQTPTAGSSGTVYVNALYLNQGVTVNNITVYTASGNVATQADITHGWLAFLDDTLTVQAVSADQADAAFCTVAATKYTLAMGAPYVTTYSGLYYLAMGMTVSAGNMPQMISGQTPGPPNTTTPVLQGSAGAQGAPPALLAQLNSGTITGTGAGGFYAFTS
jgi:hypothetical protein